LLMAPEATCLAGDVNVPARLLLYGRFCGVHEWPLLGVHRGSQLFRFCIRCVRRFSWSNPQL